MGRIHSLIRRLRPRMRFLTLHYAYFTGTCLISSFILWGAAQPFGSLRYIDALYLAVSAMTLAGLNTVNLPTLTTFQQLWLFFLIILGSAIWVSIAVLLTRRRAFERRFGDIIREQRLQRRSAREPLQAGPSLSLSRSFRRRGTASDSLNLRSVPAGRAQAPDRNVVSRQPSSYSSRQPGGGTADLPVATAAGVEQRQPSRESAEEKPTVLNRKPSVTSTPGSANPNNCEEDKPTRLELKSSVNSIPSSADLNNREEYSRLAFASDVLPPREQSSSRYPRPHLLPPYTNYRQPSELSDRAPRRGQNPDSGHEPLAFLRHVGRNSTFPTLTEEERDKLGGVEYRAVCLLTIIVPIYFVAWQFLGGLAVGAYVARNKSTVTETNGLAPWWAGFFFAISAFNNSGMSLVDANMVPFRSSTFMLITMGLLILAGNTCYPIFLRWILYAMLRLLPKHPYFQESRDTLRFLLEHPRRCYTNLFPSLHTWWLLCAVVVLNGIDWVMFEVLNIDNPAVNTIPVGSRVLDGLFQALCVRNGGFYLVSISALQLGMQVIYVIMMYISVYPLVITMRNSNVYEERSLGIYADDMPSASQDPNGQQKNLPGKTPSGRLYFIQQQLRAQLAYDLWWIALAVIIICIVEAGSFTRDPVTYSAFNIIFETVSAYGTVGISTGLPDQMYSFSGGWHTLSKLVLCVVMLRGRHRGLPVAIDKAILLPGEHLIQAEQEDAYIRLERTMSRSRSRTMA
ncbi:putative cation transporter [Aspergillus novofumigatus IBT 16806]|uniref:Potassium transport protein n=1 Tax=Aspergillus novofumigatus (strain IBT 16806) TaxID=1392255 RepID=A0A2I1C1F9_ASPN1|nr:putative cation transporter [Aspergillus novofumigatus IBT 16806]PKX91476.1 putative cation transporter [Aspergillus novofumigatus IBT 16806]